MADHRQGLSLRRVAQPPGQLARDIGDALGTGAHLTALRRTRVGVHDVARAVPLEKLDDAALVAMVALPALDAVSHMPRVDITAADVKEIGHGRAIRLVPTETPGSASPADTDPDAPIALASRPSEPGTSGSSTRSR